MDVAQRVCCPDAPVYFVANAIVPELFTVTTALGRKVFALDDVFPSTLCPVKQNKLPSLLFAAYKVEVAEPETLIAFVPVPGIAMVCTAVCDDVVLLISTTLAVVLLADADATTTARLLLLKAVCATPDLPCKRIKTIKDKAEKNVFLVRLI